MVVGLARHSVPRIADLWSARPKAAMDGAAILKLGLSKKGRPVCKTNVHDIIT